MRQHGLITPFRKRFLDEKKSDNSSYSKLIWKGLSNKWKYSASGDSIYWEAKGGRGFSLCSLGFKLGQALTVDCKQFISEQAARRNE